MIEITNVSAAAFDERMLSRLERTIYYKKKKSPVTYRYDSAEALLSELHIRTLIVESAFRLDKSGAEFANFKKSRCNEAYWHKTELGGFRLKGGIPPHVGLWDIFQNGYLYAFECSTAVIIVLYRAVSETIGPRKFDEMFANLFLYDGQYDSDLRLHHRENIEESAAGDLLYFENPDHAPSSPWWRGENVIKTDEGLYYGHNIGINSAQTIIAFLNRFRVPGSQRSAFLTDQFLQLDFSYYSRL
jgi:protein-glutamine gamma-glutamyltransferase